MLHCDLRVRWKVASDLRLRAAISDPQTHSFYGNSGDVAQSTQGFSPAIIIVNLLVGRFARIDSRFARESRIFSANRFSLRKNFLLRIDLPKKGIAARIGRETRNFSFNANRREDAIRADLATCFKNRHFSRESIRANLRNVGVRIALPAKIVIVRFWCTFLPAYQKMLANPQLVRLRMSDFACRCPYLPDI